MPDEPTASIRLNLTGPLLQGVEAWRKAQDKIPPRTVAIRKILAQALAETRAA